ncbi:acyl-CoA thioesterase [Sporomusa sp.]|jgi:acyl-CoA hydrolase|uniref:acyl-CoA thioesterase n=1 Tax=Sporomusa sp. TaxID=2078658 RepID=UPI002973242A|nr:acyl-CoA thioesterase [Sporomusa sp.]MDF2572780.1 ThioeSPTERase superfamily protein [Sporomusa sp.]MDF2876863.1 ThioeSPTERase superfamily protein [Sporomusa sp.]HWR05736.1 acyl-CoA thioesterase [Sporomusa sp.]
MKKSSSESRLVISEVMMPSQANVAGNIHGGEIMKLMDSTAYAAARRYARSNVVTARVDELEFHLPIFIGDLVICTGQVVFAGKSSMEVAVTVEVEDLECEGRKRALSAFFTMVSLDKKGRPNIVPELILDTSEEKTAFEEGKRRYEAYKTKKQP